MGTRNGHVTTGCSAGTVCGCRVGYTDTTRARGQAGHVSFTFHHPPNVPLPSYRRVVLTADDASTVTVRRTSCIRTQTRTP